MVHDGSFQSLKLDEYVFVCHQHLPELRIDSHNLNIDLNGEVAVQHTRQHEDTVFCEGKGNTLLPPHLEVAFCDFKFLIAET